ncbi:hypothetical protein HK13_04020 [Acetobacter indonesiensis]|nr:hypothetical protein HK13_04020 [Acetobacter indonesiensis]
MLQSHDSGYEIGFMFWQPFHRQISRLRPFPLSVWGRGKQGAARADRSAYTSYTGSDFYKLSFQT